MKYACCAMMLFGVCGGTWSAVASDEEPVRWQVVKSVDGWRLLRNGKPFYVQGAVGWNRFDVLKTCGGNAVRATANRATLDAAQREGLAVMANPTGKHYL